MLTFELQNTENYENVSLEFREVWLVLVTVVVAIKTISK
jgi:hypothetical protein